MEYCFCIDLVSALREGVLTDRLAQIRDSGCGFVETALNTLNGAEDAEIDKIKKQLRLFGLKCQNANCMFPWNIKLCGGERDLFVVLAYAKEALAKAMDLGIKTVVLGSGASRRIPEGYDINQAEDEFADMTSKLCELADAYGVRIALEHLNPNETNFMTTIRDTVRILKKISKQNCGFVFDSFHADLCGEDTQNILSLKDKLFHVHCARPIDRRLPRESDGELFAPFFRLIKQAGYSDKISFEPDLGEQLLLKEALLPAVRLLELNLDS